MLAMKKVEILFTDLYKLCQFKRGSESKDCQMDFDKKLIRGRFPEAEIKLAAVVFGAIITEKLPA
jgi:hypothetical protein